MSRRVLLESPNELTDDIPHRIHEEGVVDIPVPIGIRGDGGLLERVGGVGRLQGGLVEGLIDVAGDGAGLVQAEIAVLEVSRSAIFPWKA